MFALALTAAAATITLVQDTHLLGMSGGQCVGKAVSTSACALAPMLCEKSCATLMSYYKQLYGDGFEFGKCVLQGGIGIVMKCQDGGVSGGNLGATGGLGHPRAPSASSNGLGGGEIFAIFVG